MNLGQFAATLLAHRGHHGALHNDAAKADEIYQTSTMAALLAGIYDGDVTVAELLEHGDFGLGTFNHLDGEMVILDGRCYHLSADGSVRIADLSERTPFAVVTHFKAQSHTPADSLTRAQLTARTDRQIPSLNLLYAVRLDARFAHVSTRTVSAQHRPYPPLTKATAGQVEQHLDDVTGTMVGFRTPDYEQGISVAGYHLHFIDDLRATGGHVMDFEVATGSLSISTASELHLSLPRSGPFLTTPLAGEDLNEQIKSAES